MQFSSPSVPSSLPLGGRNSEEVLQGRTLQMPFSPDGHIQVQSQLCVLSGENRGAQACGAPFSEGSRWALTEVGSLQLKAPVWVWPSLMGSNVGRETPPVEPDTSLRLYGVETITWGQAISQIFPILVPLFQEGDRCGNSAGKA